MTTFLIDKMEDQDRRSLARNTYLYSYRETPEEFLSTMLQELAAFDDSFTVFRLNETCETDEHEDVKQALEKGKGKGAQKEKGKGKATTQHPDSASPRQTYMLAKYAEAKTRHMTGLIPLLGEADIMVFLAHMWKYYGYFRNTGLLQVRNLSCLSDVWGAVRQ